MNFTYTKDITLSSEQIALLDQVQSNIQTSYVQVLGISVCDEKIQILSNEELTEEQLNGIVSAAESTALSPVFKAQECDHDLFVAFSGELSELQQYYPVISKCLIYGNTQAFQTLKAYADGLLSGGKITQQTYDSFKTIMKNNGVDFDVYQ